MTQIESAKQGIITAEMEGVGKGERLGAETVRERIAAGRLVIPANINRRATGQVGIGEGLRTKVNANIGTSVDFADLETELEKLKAAEEAGADAVMDLSTGGDLTGIRRSIIERSSISVGTVPIYEATCSVMRESHRLRDMSAADVLGAFRKHAEDGVDFVVAHAAINREVLKEYRATKRVCGIVSRGGTFLAQWMLQTGQENPLYELYDELLDIAREYDVTLSLGDSMRPGAIADAFDSLQVHELMIQGELARRAMDGGVQVMIEGPGHVPLNQVKAQMELEKSLCHGAPFYVLGPVVTDVAMGYDHITAAIGGAVAAASGADFLCYVTPSEHIGLPSPEQVREGVIAARIAAHAGDIAKGIPGASDWDRRLSEFRRARKWDEQIKESIDPQRAASYREDAAPEDESVCSMCGEYCVFKMADLGAQTP